MTVAAEIANRLHVLTISEMRVATWTTAVEYLVSHAGRWIPAAELGDYVYRGACSRAAPHVLIRRARAAGVRIESSAFGYRVGRIDRPVCRTCGGLVIDYGDDLVCYGCIGTEYADLDVGRAPYREGSRQGRRWTAEEIQFVLDNDSSMGLEELGQRLDRTASAVRGLRATLGLSRKTYVRDSR